MPWTLDWNLATAVRKDEVGGRTVKLSYSISEGEIRVSTGQKTISRVAFL